MSRTARGTVVVPAQDDVRTNRNALSTAATQENQRGFAAAELPEMQSWRQYDPARQSDAYRFLLKEVLGAEALAGKVKGYADLEAQLARMEEFDTLARAMHEVSYQGDHNPVRMQVLDDAPGARHIATYLPPEVKELFRRYVEGGWTAVSGDERYGGGGIPHAVLNSLIERAMAANPGCAVLTFLTEGVAAALEAKGDEALKQAWLPLLKSGEFTGAMVMTEPKYGSSLSDMETTVFLDADGKTGRVEGYKRFLSSADHDATEGPAGERRIVHMVLARTADAEGNILTDAKGRPRLTLMLVPRLLLNAEGQPIDEAGEVTDQPHPNHVRAAKLNSKMGLEVQSNTDAAYDGAIGYVVGEVGDGLKNMFVIMNEARIGVGLQGVAGAELAYQNALTYAEQRRQGPGGEIIHYPNVQEKLLNMRAHIDAGRTIATEVALALDIVQKGDPAQFSPAEIAAQQAYVDVMTPLVKWGLTEKGYASVDQAVQLMGGEGYMEEAGMAQVLKDMRIARIYEGANDVLAVAQVTFQLKHMDVFLNRMRDDLNRLQEPAVTRYILPGLRDQLGAFEQATKWLQAVGLRARGGDDGAKQEFQSAANHYMELMYGLAAGSALARHAEVAARLLREGSAEPEQQGEYKAKIATARYYFNAVLAPERGMHLAKMKHNYQYLDLPDRGIEQQPRTLMQAGATLVNQALIQGHKLIDALRKTLALARQQGGRE